MSDLVLWEFALGVVLVPLLLYAAIRPRRKPRRARAAPWRRHAQVVRALPDPALRAARDPLVAWVEQGAALEEAARVLARASATDESAREAAYESILTRARSATSRHAREAFVRSFLDPTHSGA